MRFLEVLPRQYPRPEHAGGIGTGRRRLTCELAPILNQPQDVAAAQIEANLAKLAEMGLLEA